MKENLTSITYNFITKNQFAKDEAAGRVGDLAYAFNRKIGTHFKIFTGQRPILMALGSSTLHDRCEHDNKMTTFLLHHTPEVGGGTGQRSLRCNVTVNATVRYLHIYIVCVDVVAALRVYQYNASAVVCAIIMTKNMKILDLIVVDLHGEMSR